MLMDQSRYKRQIYTRTGEMKATSQEGHFSLLRAALASWPWSSLILCQPTGQFFRLHIPSFLCQERTFHQFSSSLIPSATSNYIILREKSWLSSFLSYSERARLCNIQYKRAKYVNYLKYTALLIDQSSVPSVQNNTNITTKPSIVIFMFEFMSGRAILYSPILENVMCSQVLKY